MPASIHLDGFDTEPPKELGIRKPRETAFSKDDLRGLVLNVLGLLANLSRSECERVLNRTLKVNKVK